MDQVFVFVLMMAAVVLANVLAKHLPVIPLPFWLIGLGMVLAIFPFFRSFTLDPSVFAFAIITPLLFNEGQNASRLWIGRTLGNILSLAVGLVLVTVLVLGFGLSAVTFVPLSLAFALIAIVTPTDASAVTAISRTNPLSEGQLLILENESLFNDAAGIVAFDLALAAFVSGQFSAWQATGQFLYVAIGGILFGAIVGTLIVSLRTQLIKWGDDEPADHHDDPPAADTVTGLLLLRGNGLLRYPRCRRCWDRPRRGTGPVTAHQRADADCVDQCVGNGDWHFVWSGICLIGRHAAHCDQRRLVRQHVYPAQLYRAGHLFQQTDHADFVESLLSQGAPQQTPLA